MVAYAASHTEAARSLLEKINDNILFPLISLMVAVALLVFLWGAFEYIANAGDEAKRTSGRRHMIFGVIGLLIMVSAYAILRIAANTFGVDVPN